MLKKYGLVALVVKIYYAINKRYRVTNSIINIKTKAERFYNESGQLYLKIDAKHKNSGAFIYPSMLKTTSLYINYNFEIDNYNEAIKFFRPSVVDNLKHLRVLCDHYNKNRNGFLKKEEHLFGDEYLMALCVIFTDCSLIIEEIKRIENKIYFLKLLGRLNNIHIKAQKIMKGKSIK